MDDTYYYGSQDPDFPEAFRQVYMPPAGIYIHGDRAGLKKQPRLSVVGTRAVSAYGRDVTNRLVREVVQNGVSIISGLALGVDSLAHRAALEMGGYTVAVLAGGLDRIHPRNHTRLAKEIIASGGAILSEYAFGEPAMKHRFIERNRLVAALGDALLITEAALKSGTMHTVRYALGMGKTVLTVPGNITSPTSQGTNNLIRDGAIPVTDVKDILIALGISCSAQQQLPIGSNAEESTLIDLIQQGITDVHDLQQGSHLATNIFNQTLTMLELTGKIQSLGGGHWGLR